jgi:hypothetical protein
MFQKVSLTALWRENVNRTALSNNIAGKNNARLLIKIKAQKKALIACVFSQ